MIKPENRELVLIGVIGVAILILIATLTITKRNKTYKKGFDDGYRQYFIDRYIKPTQQKEG